MTSSIFHQRAQERALSGPTQQAETRQPAETDIFHKRAQQKEERSSIGGVLNRLFNPLSGDEFAPRQVALGALSKFTWPADVAKGVGQYESLTDMYDYLQTLKKEHPEMTDEDLDTIAENYLKEIETAKSAVPTQADIEEKIEQGTGIKLRPDPNDPLAKGMRYAGQIAGITPGSIETKALYGASTEGMRESLIYQGVPEGAADAIAPFIVGKVETQPPPKMELSIGPKTKPSGMKERFFENVKEPTEVSAQKLDKISRNVEKDFRKLADEIVIESPSGNIAKELENNPRYKAEAKELLENTQLVADNTPGTVTREQLKKAIIPHAKERVKGVSIRENDKEYLRALDQLQKGLVGDNLTYGGLIKEYRKTNKELGEYYEPGKSRGYNNARKHALLDYNRGIASLVEETQPELGKILREGNERWHTISNLEDINNFVDEIFKGDRINYKDIEKILYRDDYNFAFKKALGEEGFEAFKELLYDMLETQKPYSMLKVAKKKGYEELFKTGLSFILHPKLGQLKSAMSLLNSSYKYLLRASMDKPKIMVNLKFGVDELKKGHFEQAEKYFGKVDAELYTGKPPPPPPEETKALEAPRKGIEVKEKPQEKPPSGFKTAKGSTYEITPEGTTTRNKEARKEHTDSGPQKTSEKTYYISKEDANKLSEFQTSGEGKRIVELPDGSIGVMYETGKDAGKIEARTVIKPKQSPGKGLIPVESWEGGKEIHFGNEITEIIKD